MAKLYESLAEVMSVSSLFNANPTLQCLIKLKMLQFGNSFGK